METLSLEPHRISYSLSLPRIKSEKIDHLVQYQHDPGSLPTHLPLLDPYQVFQNDLLGLRALRPS